LVDDVEAFLEARPTLEELLDAIAARAAGWERAVLVCHAPPQGTGLGNISPDTDVGSAAVRAWIERYQPLLTLHGHIHESPRVTGIDTVRSAKSSISRAKKFWGIIFDRGERGGTVRVERIGSVLIGAPPRNGATPALRFRLPERPNARWEDGDVLLVAGKVVSIPKSQEENIMDLVIIIIMIGVALIDGNLEDEARSMIIASGDNIVEMRAAGTEAGLATVGSEQVLGESACPTCPFHSRVSPDPGVGGAGQDRAAAQDQPDAERRTIQPA
jgi:hypothetical protein